MVQQNEKYILSKQVRIKWLQRQIDAGNKPGKIARRHVNYSWHFISRGKRENTLKKSIGQ